MSKPDFQFYSRPEYFEALITHARQASKGDSITIMSMNFDPLVELVGQLMDELCKAARRGITVRLIVDAMDFILDHKSKPGPLFYGRPLTAASSGTFGERFAFLENLRAAGGHYWIINKPTRPLQNPVAGRSHIKLALINDQVYLGGCNIDTEKRIDLMVSWHDQKTAAWLYELTEEIAAAGNTRQALRGKDQTLDINDTTKIYIDSGIKKQSLIYTQALEFIDQANEQATITCQYFPGGPTAQHLVAAQKRGASITIYFSGPKTHEQPLGHYLYNMRERLRVPANFFARQLPDEAEKLHSKLIVTEHGAMLGSHNFVDVGVKLGTAEIALQVLDPAFAKAAEAKLTKLLPKSVQF